jgi:hypothetical protein
MLLLFSFLLCNPLVGCVLLLPGLVLECAARVQTRVELALGRSVIVGTFWNSAVATVAARSLSRVLVGAVLGIPAVGPEGALLLRLKLLSLCWGWMFADTFLVLTGRAKVACVVHVDGCALRSRR